MASKYIDIAHAKKCVDCEVFFQRGFIVKKSPLNPSEDPIFLCAVCASIRENYFKSNRKPLPIEVVCDGCCCGEHNEHHCSRENVIVDGIQTRKKCTCEECAGIEQLFPR